MITVIRNGNILDTRDGCIVGERTIVIDDGEIEEINTSQYRGHADVDIDAGGKFVMPGLIDAHVHHTFPTMDLGRLLLMSPVEVAIGMSRAARGFLNRGFTTVRDTGGKVGGLVSAIQNGMTEGPRIIRAGRMISQTGGHGDFRPTSGAESPSCICQIHSDTHDNAHITDGPDGCRKAARTELRDGADFIKIMTSGGVSSPNDPFDSIQFTAEEIRAVTTETDHRYTYTTSHAYMPEAISLAIENGVKCIEHGNMLDAPTAKRMAELGVALVPTLITYRTMEEIGAQSGLPSTNLEKNAGVFEAGLEAVEIARAAGVELGWGTDLLGEGQSKQNQEFAIRSELEPAVDVLKSIYETNVRLCGLEGEIGRVEGGYAADLIFSEVDPIENLAGLAVPENISTVIQAGQVIRSTLVD